jgi:hypothetical protein
MAYRGHTPYEHREIRLTLSDPAGMVGDAQPLRARRPLAGADCAGPAGEHRVIRIGPHHCERELGPQKGCQVLGNLVAPGNRSEDAHRAPALARAARMSSTVRCT